jgi:mono/diheme cytochrome c family protein
MSKSVQSFALAGAIVISFCLWLHSNRIASASGAEGSMTEVAGDVGSLYNKRCAECHGKDGRSKSFKGKLTHARNLTDADWQERVSDERIYNSISNGKEKMPAFGKKLSEAEINSLVTYIRNLKK